MPKSELGGEPVVVAAVGMGVWADDGELEPGREGGPPLLLSPPLPLAISRATLPLLLLPLLLLLFPFVEVVIFTSSRVSLRSTSRSRSPTATIPAKLIAPPVMTGLGPVTEFEILRFLSLNS